MITGDDFNEFLDKDVQAENLFISECDLKPLKDFYNDMEQDNQTVYLMRFAVTDYMLAEVDLFDPSDYYNWNSTEYGDHYFCEKTIFHNFDVLDFTFKDENDVRVIVPVSSRPINIIGSITPTLNNGPSIFDKLNNAIDQANDIADWLKFIIFAVGLFLIVFIFISPLSKLLDFIFDRSDKRFERRQKRRELRLKKKQLKNNEERK